VYLLTTGPIEEDKALSPSPQCALPCGNRSSHKEVHYATVEILIMAAAAAAAASLPVPDLLLSLQVQPTAPALNNS
jgi:hypothetical protein